MFPLDPEIMRSPYYPLMSPLASSALKKKRVIVGYVSFKLRF